MKKEDKKIVLQYIKSSSNVIEEILIDGKVITQVISFGLKSRKRFSLFIGDELLEPFASYYEMCQNENKNSKEPLGLNSYFGKKSLQELIDVMGDTELKESVDYLNSLGLKTVEEYIYSPIVKNIRIDNIHLTNNLLIYEGLTALAFSPKKDEYKILKK